MTRDQIASIVTAPGDILAVLRDADPTDKAEIYSQLGGGNYEVRRQDRPVLGEPARRF
jgi:hypothetical protein